MNRSVRTLEGQVIPTGALALWTILQIRWPLLADHLARQPDWITGSEPPGDLPNEVRTLLADDHVRAVVTFEDGGPLTPDLLRACRGG